MSASKGRSVGLLVAVATLCAACFGTPGTTVTSATTAVYTTGATRDTVSARLPRSPARVYASMNKLITEDPGAEVKHRNERSYMIEAAWSDGSVTAQATELGPSETLLFLWIDAGDTGMTAKEVATTALESLCDELNVTYELVEY